MKNNSKKRCLFSLSALAVGARVFSGTSSFTGLSGTTARKKQGDKYYPGFSTLEEAQKAAQDLNVELSAEGNVLLKNENNTLPLGIGSYVSVFGTNAYAPVGGGVASKSNRKKAVTLADAREQEGFHVNKALATHYSNQGVSATSGPRSSGGAISDQFNNFDGTVRTSFGRYSDAAVVVLGRNAGEGSDVSRATGERATAEDIASHKQLATYKKGSQGDTGGGWPFSIDGNKGSTPVNRVDAPAEEEAYTSKHALRLTEDERALIKDVKANFKKVIVLLNTSNVMEIGELKNDPRIDARRWIGRPGEDGLFGTAKILSGEINPSGKLVDEWPMDLTADPTWQNFGDNSQTGSSHKYYKADGSLRCNRPQYKKDENGNLIPATEETKSKYGSYFTYEIEQGAQSDDWTDLGVDYEEDIYNGYRYYQTRYEDRYANNPAAAKEWYEKNVAYGFGDGRSYTKFARNIVDVYKDEDRNHKVEHNLTSAELSSDTDEAKVKKLYVEVNVKNTGSVAGKEVVQVYVKAPYTKGGIEKAAEDLVGYAKTSKLQPGQSERVVV